MVPFWPTSSYWQCFDRTSIGWWLSILFTRFTHTAHIAEHCRAFEPFAKHNRLAWHAHSALPRDTTERIICVSIPALCGVVWSVVFLCKRHFKQKTAGQWAKH